MKDVDVSCNVYLMVSIGSLLISSYSFPNSTILLALFIGKEGISIVKIKSILIESYWWFQIKDKERKGKERKRRKKVTVNTEKGKSTIVAVEKKNSNSHFDRTCIHVFSRKNLWLTSVKKRGFWIIFVTCVFFSFTLCLFLFKWLLEPVFSPSVFSR